MNAFAELRNRVQRALDDIVASGELPDGLDTTAMTVSPPRDATHGELATNVAMVVAKPAGRKPREVAEQVAQHLREDANVQSATVAGAGFINLTMTPEFWSQSVRAALRAGHDYGRSSDGAGTQVNVEFVSANPTGPLHIGHARGAVYGDALASLLSFCGYEVTREYYVNDAGAQVDTLARSAYLRYCEARGDSVELPADGYPGEYLKAVGEGLAAKHGDEFYGQPESTWLTPVREFAVAAMMDAIRRDLERLGVRMDLFSSERALLESGQIESTIEQLRERDLVYRGTLPPPKGAGAKNWEAREQLLFRATEYGDDSDRPLQKADESWTYFAPDLAYHADKIQRGFKVLIDVWGEDHGGYVRRMQAAVAALSDRTVELDIKLCRIVRLLRDGQPQVMAKRQGNVVFVQQFLEEVERDVARFILLSRKNDAALDFDVVRVLEQTRDNPVFYVHYAHARACSAMRNATEALADDLSDAALADADLSALTHAAEVALARRIAEWPHAVVVAARAHEPHRISYFLQTLAADLHSLWTAGKSDRALRLIQEDDVTGTKSRLALVRAAAVVISAGLTILGIEPREEMH